MAPRNSKAGKSIIHKMEKRKEELGLPEAELRSIVDLTPQMLAVMEPDGRISWGNEFLLDYLGISLADLSREDSRERVVHPDDLPRYSADRRAGLLRRMPFETELRLRGKDGHHRWFLIRYKPSKNEEGDILRWYGGAIDIEDRKRAEEALRHVAVEANQRRSEAVAEQQRFSDLVNSVEGIVWEADAKSFVFSFVSQEAERILGYPVEQWHREPTFWKDHLHSEDRDWAVQFRIRATQEERSHDFEYRMIAADGRTVWVRDLVTVVVENGHASQLRGVMVDITRRKQDEEAKQQQADLLNITHEAIFVRDLISSIKYWNRAAEEMYGWTAKEACGKNSHELLKTVSTTPVEQIEAQLMRTGRWEGELVHTTKDGAALIVASRWALQRDHKGIPIAILQTNSDITERKRVEQAREELEEQWRAAFESNPTMYFIIDVAGTILSLNSFGAGQLGYAVSDLVGQPVRNVFYEPDRDAVQKHAKECFEQPGRMMRWEARKIRKDGTLLWVRETGNAVVLKKRPVLLIACEDITEQKRAEEAVLRSEKELRDVIDTIPVNVWTALPDGSIDFVNQRTLETTSLSEKGALGWDWASAVHPDDLPAFAEKWRTAVAAGNPLEGEVRVSHPDGTYHWFLIRSVPLRDESGNIVRWYGSSVDIEDRKRAEEALRRSGKELRDVIETVPGMQFSARADGFVEFVTRRWLEYTGLSAEGTSGFGWQSAVHPDDVAQHTNKWLASMASGEPFENAARCRSVNGEYRWFLVRAVPLRDENGSILKWYGLLTDIEDRKRGEALLKGEKRILEMVAKGDSLPQVLDSLCRLVEEQATDSLASILLLDGDRLRHGGAPSLPKAYTDAIDGVSIGPAVGSCGTAAYRREQVIVEDIATDPLWADYRGAALPHSLRACWSTPVFSSQGNVIATFAMYYREPRSPSPREREVIDQITHLAGVAIERKLTQEALRRSEAYLAEAQRLSKTGSWAFSPVTGKTHYWSDEMFRIWGFDPKQGPPDPETVLQRIHPEDREPIQKLFQSAFGSQLTVDVVGDHRIVLPDGTVKHIHGVSRPIFNGDGRIVEYVGTAIDVTDRKQVEEALGRSEANLAEAQRLSKTGSWAYDPRNDRMLYCSEEIYRIFGIEPQDGMPSVEALLQQVHPEDRDRVRTESVRGPRETTVQTFEYRLLLPDGTIKYVLSMRRPIFDETAQIAEIIGTIIDVTERKRAEQALQRTESYLAEAQRLSKTGSWAWDPRSDTMLYCSEELYRMFDIAPAKGMPSIELFRQRVHPEDRDRVTADGVRASDDKTPHTLEYKLLLPDGTIKHVESRERLVFDGAGELVEVIGTVVDVTERKRAEQALQRTESYLAEAQRLTHTGSWAWDPVADKVLYWSEETFRIFGLDPQQGLPTGREFGERFHPEDHDRVLEYIWNSVSQKREYRVNHRIILPDGTVRHIETIGHPVLNPIGNALEYVGTAVDITERKRAEAERQRLHQLEADLARVNRVSMMGELAASLAHEIKQPIAAAATNAKTSLRWLQREPPDIGEARETVSRIVKDVLRAADIIDRNRALYRRDTPKRQPVNLNDLIREMTALLHDAANRQSVFIRAEIDEALPTITADRVQLQQVFINLMMNGIEAMRGTGGELTISSKRAENGQILLSVSDLGVGLPPENAGRIFDAFFTTKAQGSGMGLSISRRIVESHGGRLWASPNPNRGTTFHFTVSPDAAAFSGEEESSLLNDGR